MCGRLASEMLSRIPSSFFLGMFQKPTHLAIHTRTRTLQQYVRHPSKIPRYRGEKRNGHGTALREHGEVDGGGTSLVSS